jgi:hypothetical protein
MSQELMLNDDEMMDRCFECGSPNIVFDCAAYESCCMNCGLVGPYERWESMDTYIKPKTYFKHNYFSNSILPKAMEKGFKASRMDMFEMERLYKECVKRFYETQQFHKRKYMINSTFTLMKICEHMNKDVSPFVSLPKKDTLLKLEKVVNKWIL